MSTLKQVAICIIIAEVFAVAVMLAGLMAPLPGSVEFKIVQSGSMEPNMPVGSVVVIVPALDYKVGDIITFGTDNLKRIPTTHRIAGVEREAGSVRYVTKGDANEEADTGRTAYGDIVGKVVFIVPRLGYVLDFARNRKGFTLMVVLPASLIILDELLTIYGAVRGTRNKRVGTAAHAVAQQRPPERPVPLGGWEGVIRNRNAGVSGYRIILRPV